VRLPGMSDNKKYYYMKVKETFFDSEEMKILESMQNGIEYQNLYIKLCLLSLKANGELIFKSMIPYDIAMLSTVLRVNIDTVKTGIELFKRLGLVSILENGSLYMLDIQTLVGKSSTEAERVSEHRKRTKDVQMYDKCTKNVEQMLRSCTPELELEKEIEKDTKKEKKTKQPESVFFQESNQVQSIQESDFPFRDPPPIQNPNRVNTDTTNRIETARTIWNATDGLPKYRFMAISIPPDNLHPILRMLGQYSDDEVQQAIRNYADIISRSDLNPFPKYTNFAGFLAKGIELYCDEAKPYERCKKASGFETAQEKEDRERKAALAYSRKLDEEYQRQQELAECEDD